MASRSIAMQGKSANCVLGLNKRIEELVMETRCGDDTVYQGNVHIMPGKIENIFSPPAHSLA
jgi:hypothetical protein